MLGQGVRTKAKGRNIYEAAHVDVGGFRMASYDWRCVNPFS